MEGGGEGVMVGAGIVLVVALDRSAVHVLECCRNFCGSCSVCSPPVLGNSVSIL